ncbi:CheR family methyltransferase [Qipengyuania sp. CAU 1752]
MSEENPASLQIVAELLRARTGQQLGAGRMWRISGALSGVFRRQNISNVDQLVCLLTEPGGDKLADEVVEALLNNETYFFRDKSLFDLLEREILPRLHEQRRGQRTLRIWSAGCSSGQELYSIAMLLASQRERWDGWKLELLGTDISPRIIDTARAGIFSQFEVQRGLTVTQMLGCFAQNARGWQIDHSLQRMVSFRQHNLLDPLPVGTSFDLVLCRNVLLYFDPIVRQQVFERLHEVMAQDAYLVLGVGETAVGQTQVFKPASGLPGIFQPAPTAPESGYVEATPSTRSMLNR